MRTVSLLSECIHPFATGQPRGSKLGKHSLRRSDCHVQLAQFPSNAPYLAIGCLGRLVFPYPCGFRLARPYSHKPLA
jgi:hypothetical protein